MNKPKLQPISLDSLENIARNKFYDILVRLLAKNPIFSEAEWEFMGFTIKEVRNKDYINGNECLICFVDVVDPSTKEGIFFTYKPDHQSKLSDMVYAKGFFKVEATSQKFADDFQALMMVVYDCYRRIIRRREEFVRLVRIFSET